MNFYKKLIALCSERNVSACTVLSELNISKGNLYRWVNGGGAKFKTVAAIAEYFGVSTDYFLEDGEK